MDNIEKAMIFAYEKHKSQKRKTNNCPYFVHLMDVASLLYKEGASEDLVCAGFLHDSIEDFEYTGVTEIMIREEFGDKITDLVMAVTETDKSLSWLERKTNSIEHLKKASREVKEEVNLKPKILERYSPFYIDFETPDKVKRRSYNFISISTKEPKISEKHIFSNAKYIAVKDLEKYNLAPNVKTISEWFKTCLWKYKF